MDCMGQLVTLCSLPVIEWLRNFRATGDGVRELDIALSKLSSTRESLLENRVQQAQEAGDIYPPEVIDWLHAVQICEEEATKIKNEICCVQCFFFNCRPSQLLRDIERLTAQQVEAVAFRPLPVTIQKIAIRPTPFGLESYLEKVDCYLADDQVHIVGIWGTAGVGKTTLLQTINNGLLTGGILSQRYTFHHVLFVVASRDYDPEQLQESITRKLGLNLGDVHDAEVRAAVIEEFLRRRNFLLLLDDLWDLVDLEKIGIPILSYSSSPKHKVIFTTRREQVCLKMNADKDMKMGCLDSRNARLLFEHNIGQVAISKPAFGCLSENVISKCGGLPLAITTIAQALKTDSSDWQSSIEELRQSRLDEILVKDDRQSFVQLYKTLKISYDGLPGDTARKCFLSCALWPEGCPIEKLELIHSWMGLGLLDKSINCNFDEAYNKGNRIIENLKAACLLEPDLASENKVIMHSVIRDMALWIANEKEAGMKKWIVKEDSGFVTVLKNPKGWEAAQRMSLMSHGLTELPPTPECPKLSSLMLQKNPGLTKIPHDFFQFMVSLSFLDLSFTGLWELPEEIGSLLQLHYLNLSNTPISTLPDSLGRLKRLRYLLLNNTRNLTVIQYGLISSLSMLLVLDLFGCGYAEWELDDRCSGASLGELNKLEQGLKFLGVTIETSEALVQLSDIPRLSTRHLGIIGWVDETSLEQLMDLLSRPSIYQDLEVLKVENCGSSKVLTIGDNNRSWCLPRLQVLELCSLIKLREIIWNPANPSKYLPMIRELKISDCDMEDVSWVLDFQHLEHLELSKCKYMKQVVYGDPGKQVICDDRGIEVGDEEVMRGPFSGLKTLVLKELSFLRSFCDHKYDFPALEYLEVQDCQMLRVLPFSYEIIKKNSLVINGEHEWWNNLVWNN